MRSLNAYLWKMYRSSRLITRSYTDTSKGARRMKPEACVYHPAPLTKPRGSSIISQRKALVPPTHSVYIAVDQPSDSRPLPRPGLVSSPPGTNIAVHEVRGFRPSSGAPLSRVMSIESPQSSHRESSITRRTSLSGHQ